MVNIVKHIFVSFSNVTRLSARKHMQVADKWQIKVIEQSESFFRLNEIRVVHLMKSLCSSGRDSSGFLSTIGSQL